MKLPVYVSSNADLEKALNELARAIETVANKPVSFGGDLRGISNGDRLVIEGYEGDESKVYHPFQIINTTTSVSGPQVKVALDSWLMKSREVDDKATITGLDASFTVEPGDLIWIEIGVTSGAMTGAATIEHGAEWASYPKTYDVAGSGQASAYFLIGYVQAYPGTGSEVAGDPADFPDRDMIQYLDASVPAVMQIVQSLTTNLIVTEECEIYTPEEGDPTSETTLGMAPWSAVPAP